MRSYPGPWICKSLVTHASDFLIPILFLNPLCLPFGSWKRRHPQQWCLQASGFILGKFEAKDIKLIKTTLCFEAFNLNIIPSLKLRLMWHFTTFEESIQVGVMGSQPVTHYLNFAAAYHWHHGFSTFMFTIMTADGFHWMPKKRICSNTLSSCGLRVACCAEC